MLRFLLTDNIVTNMYFEFEAGDKWSQMCKMPFAQIQQTQSSSCIRSFTFAVQP